MALSPGFRADFRGIALPHDLRLTGIGVTILSTVEVDESFTQFPFSTYSISFLTDDILRLRYVSIDGQLRKIMVVIKMRAEIMPRTFANMKSPPRAWLSSANASTDYQGLISGLPVHSDRSGPNQERHGSRKSGTSAEQNTPCGR